MTPHDLAARFLTKAAQDEALVDRVIADQGIADDIVGFHLQQAAEKLLKSVLAARAVTFRRTHDLLELMDTLADAGTPVPDGLRDLDALNPFAVEARYDILPPSSPPLDRGSLRGQIFALRAWAEAVITANGVAG